MASRLSDETLGDSLKGVLDAGQQGMVIQAGQTLAGLSPLHVDLDALLLCDDPAAAVQALAPQALFQALLIKGPEDCLDVLELMAPEQVVRLLDYDAWRHDELEPRRAVRWLNLFKEVSDEELYKRFRDLDEEYQLALLNPLIDVIDEDEFEDLTDEQQDALYRLPCGTLYYRIKSEDPILVEFVQNLVEATLQTDVSYAYAFLTYAAFLPPHEAEDQIAQFRRARLTEDGFVTYEESMQAFRPLDVAVLKKRLLTQLKPDQSVSTTQMLVEHDEGLFLSKVLLSLPSGEPAADELRERVQQTLVFLSNSLCAAGNIEPDDLPGLRLLLVQAQALVSLGLEHLADGDVHLGALILRQEHAQLLFRAGLNLVRALADSALAQLAKHGLPGAVQLRRQFQLDRRGSLLSLLDGQLLPLLGFERTELLKGLCNRFPVQPSLFRPDDRGAQRVIFAPIASRTALGELAESLDTMSGLLAVASLADDDQGAATMTLDLRLGTALAQALIGGQFRAEALDQAGIEKLLSLPDAAAQSLTSDLFAGIESSLRLRLAPAAKDQSWSVSSASACHVVDPLQGVMAELANLSLRLGALRAYARDLPSAALRFDALRPIVNLISTDER